MAGRRLRDSVVLVTGASSGVGRATALALAAEGARLVLASRSGEALAEVEQQCRARGAEVLAVPTDIADPDAVERLASSAVRRYGRIDTWIEAVAVGIAGPLGSESVDEIRRLVDTNVFGTTLCARAAVTTFQAQGHGTLVMVGSLLSLFPNPMVPLYSMSKFAIRGLALNLRQAVAGNRRIHVCLVLPGPIDTPFFERAANHTGRRLRAIPPAYAPERVAATIIACARRPRRQATTGVVSHLALAAYRLAPRATEAAVAQWSMRLVTGPTAAPASRGSLFDAPPTGAVHGGYRRGRLRRRLGEWLAGSAHQVTDG
ncbi:short-subunit dehydrogenase [Actinoplanes campanulatus]|uniref:Short-subunit dehydrogenase n=1 Tax=Actinoplanes campanulatus TaxID=113559 RepID=A0A7W5ASJ9_9ACTN|nr:SDR family NAD(P)-dependent oxidoreductase [Actinoplanes campanulatus]MBB3101556.1 short-subunit dehydrogenase [Actinoplanes campanulatus]GGN51428.1 short-chain dehydrogenase [Actinoplanes campanulatus]GID42618.1 short-chain dehydrogenase [Actinoplanes campanulatus]